MIYGEKAKVVEVKVLDARHVRMKLRSPKIAASVLPGQFVNIICGGAKFGERVFDSPEEFLAHKHGEKGEECYGKRILRRPFAVHKVESVGGKAETFKILFKIVGKGSAALAEMKAGEEVDVLGPLGKGFDLKEADEANEAVLVAGGVGVAPLYQLAQHLRAKGKKVYAFIGALDESQIPLETADAQVALSFMESPEEVGLTSSEFDEIGVTVGIATEQGTRGYRGLVTKLLEKYLKSVRSSARRKIRVYACGPWGMMRATAAICERERVPCEVLLEERMGCGVGACMACSVEVKTEDGGSTRKRICMDGPVFNAREVVWNG